ncbi:MAG: ribonuclease P protein subunit [Nitrosopumilus sp.]|uniref:ribonuclease P protein component 1 n=1 Tax=Nitrosopumilus sp. TaxID=2024843 RepID=UPI00247E6732|nr:ribonuclease P protein subunit [Nitrosopumilus sp.]MCV0392195.1 ribonuclease P protein subunit [Nitrosopumilus sp.]
MITAENITSHELIGLNTRIIQSTNPQVVGLNGRIVDETKSMFTIDTKKGQKLIAKSTSSWSFSIENKEIIIEGSRITKRSFDRIGGKT